MKRLLYALVLGIGSIMLATGCGSSNNNSTPAATTCSPYGTSPYGYGTSPYGTSPYGTSPYGYGTTPYSLSNCVGTTGAYGYGSCSPCVTPNGQSGVLVNFDGVPTCGLALAGSGAGMIDGQIFQCYNGGGLGVGTVPGYGGVYGGTYGTYSPYSPYYPSYPTYLKHR